MLYFGATVKFRFRRQHDGQRWSVDTKPKCTLLYVFKVCFFFVSFFFNWSCLLLRVLVFCITTLRPQLPHTCARIYVFCFLILVTIKFIHNRFMIIVSEPFSRFFVVHSCSLLGSVHSETISGYNKQNTEEKEKANGKCKSLMLMLNAISYKNRILGSRN